MPSLKALRVRIKSVKNTRQITKTMKMVAAAKVRKARAAVDGARPYANKLAAVLANVAAGSAGGSLLLTGRPNPKTALLVVVGSDRGLCGALNTNLLKQAEEFITTHRATRTIKLVAVGRKVRDAFKSTHPDMLLHSFAEMGRAVEFAHAQTIAAYALAQFENGTADEVHLLYAACTSMLAQTPTVQPLIPFASGTAPINAGPTASIEYEPDAETVLEQLLPLNLNQQVFAALLETQASEQAARMTAMDNATRNAGEMIQRLTITYNRQRQAAITTELIEIIAGAEAL